MFSQLRRLQPTQVTPELVRDIRRASKVLQELALAAQQLAEALGNKGEELADELNRRATP